MLLLVLLATSACNGAARTLRTGVVTGRGRAPPPALPGAAEVAPPRFATSPVQARPRAPTRVISEFDAPGGFRPQSNPYRGVALEATTEQVLVSGPPLGDDYRARYIRRIRQHQQTRLPSGFAPNGRWQGDKGQGFLQPPKAAQHAPVHLHSPSSPVGSFGFAPNRDWAGQPETGLLKHVPDTRRRPAVGVLPSPSLGSGLDFAPNSGWQGEPAEGLARPIRGGVVSQAPLSSPSSAFPSSPFSPSSWLVDRQKFLDTGARRPNPQDEPAVITLDNVGQWFSGQQGRPDIYTVNVATSINTRGAQAGGLV